MKKSVKKVDKWQVKIACKNCKSKMRLKEADIELGDFGGLNSFGSNLKHFSLCPNCHNHNIVDNSKIPVAVKKKAKERFEKELSKELSRLDPFRTTKYFIEREHRLERYHSHH